jgi:hypothetical protein
MMDAAWHTVSRHPRVQIPAAQIGVVIAQVDNPLPSVAQGGSSEVRR